MKLQLAMQKRLEWPTLCQQLSHARMHGGLAAMGHAEGQQAGPELGNAFPVRMHPRISGSMPLGITLHGTCKESGDRLRVAWR